MRSSLAVLAALLAVGACSSEEPAESDATALITYVETRAGDAETRLVVIGDDGTGYRELATGLDGSSSPAVSPGGGSIFFWGYLEDTGSAWLSVPPSGGASTNLQMSTDLHNPRFSPSGREIAWLHYDLTSRVAVSARGSSSVTDLTPTVDFIDPEVSWAPDNSRLVVKQRNVEFGTDLAVVSLAGVTTPLVTTLGEQTSPAWSPTADQVAYVQPFTDAPTNGIYIVTADGARTRQLVSGLYDGVVFWSPDGKTIAFWGHLDGSHTNPRFVLIDVATGFIESSTPFNGLSYPALEPWSKDGSRLLLYSPSAVSGNWAIFTMDRSGTLTQVTADSVTATLPAWVQ